ncbi:unnamed protein product [Closterium sp. NIES-65]|nr:unnamed protein product [Closterium sp. NIES-65]
MAFHIAGWRYVTGSLFILATLVLQNSGLRDVKGWDVIIEFTHNELITAIKYAQVGPELPYPGKNLIISGIPELSDTIVTAIHAGGDSTLYSVNASISGTEYGAPSPPKALPRTLYLINPGYKCQRDFPQFPSDRSLQGLHAVGQKNSSLLCFSWMQAETRLQYHRGATSCLREQVGRAGDLMILKSITKSTDTEAISSKCSDNCTSHVHWHIVDFYQEGFVAKQCILLTTQQFPVILLCFGGMSIATIGY